MPSQASSTVFQHLQGVLSMVISLGPSSWHMSGQRGRKGIPAGRKAGGYLQGLGGDSSDALASYTQTQGEGRGRLSQRRTWRAPVIPSTLWRLKVSPTGSP